MTRVVSEVNFMPLEPPVGEFNLSRLERVIYGPGKIATLKDEMERRDLHRGLVVTTRGVAELPILKEVTGALGSRCAGGLSAAHPALPATLITIIDSRAADGAVDLRLLEWELTAERIVLLALGAGHWNTSRDNPGA